MQINRSTLAKGALVAFAAMAIFLVVTEHRAHAFGVLAYLFLVICPVLLYVVTWSRQDNTIVTGTQPDPAAVRTNAGPKDADRDETSHDKAPGAK